MNPSDGINIRLTRVGRANGQTDQATTLCPLFPTISMKPTNVDTFVEVTEIFDGHGSINVNLSDDEWPEATSI